MRKTPSEVVDTALDTWNLLNDDLRTADEARCEELLKAEKAWKARPTFIRRIHSRLNKVRADRERRELVEDVR